MFPCDSAHASFSGVVTKIEPRLIEGLVETFPARPRQSVQATGTAGRLRRSACHRRGQGLTGAARVLWRFSLGEWQMERHALRGAVPPSPWNVEGCRGRAGNVSTSPPIEARIALAPAEMCRPPEKTRLRPDKAALPLGEAK